MVFRQTADFSFKTVESSNNFKSFFKLALRHYLIGLLMFTTFTNIYWGFPVLFGKTRNNSDYTLVKVFLIDLQLTNNFIYKV